MHKLLRDIPLAKKLTLFTVITSLVCLILAILAIIGYQSYAIEKTMRSQLSVIASILSTRSTEAIVLNDNDLAKFTLRSLRLRNSIVASCIYKVSLANQHTRLVSVMARYPLEMKSCPDATTIDQDTFIESDHFRELIHPIRLEGRLLGYIYLKTDISNVKVLRSRLLVVFLAILAAALMTSLWIATRFSNWIMLPLIALEKTARAITTHDDYTLRAEKFRDDEVGQFVDSFNQMLARIETEDSKLRDSEEKFRMISASLKAGVFQLDTEGNCIFANQALAIMVGLEIEEIMQNNWLQAIHGDDIKAIQSQWHEMITRQCPMPISCRIRGAETHWVTGHIEPMRTANDDVIGFLGTLNDITDVKNAQLQLEQMAFFDPLTGLANRRLFRQRLENVIGNTSGNGGGVALALVDIDQFKHTNDSLGHDTGDNLLKLIADRLQACVRSSDTVARLGADEFAIILPGTKSLSSISSIVQNILDELKEPIHLQDAEVRITASAGISIMPSDADNAETLIKNADLALHRAKDSGRNSYCFFTAEMNSDLLNQLELIDDLRTAVEAEQFSLVFQPQVNLKSRQLIGFEALLRWQHPQRGWVSPADFIPHAEDTGLIIPLGRWVITQACRQLHRLLKERLVSDDVVMTVNVSARQFQDHGLVDFIYSQLQDYELTPSQFELELTETVLMENLDEVIEKLNALRDLGILISIDDFGTGYSSLGYLKKLPVHIVKVDRSFVTDIPNNRDDMEITAAVIAMAHSLNYEVVAEGVETVEQLKFLEDCGCDYGQGYLFGKPLTEADLVAYCHTYEAKPAAV